MHTTTIGEGGLGRSGRKRKPGRRHRSGDLVRDKHPDDKVRASRQPHRRGLKEGDRLSERAESPLGRLALKGVIDQNQLIACEHYTVLVGQYRATIGAPRSTAGSGRGAGCSGDCTTDSDCACAAVRNRYMRAYDAIAAVGRNALLAVNRVVLQGEEPTPQDLVYLDPGSNALARHFGLTRRRRGVYSGNAN